MNQYFQNVPNTFFAAVKRPSWPTTAELRAGLNGTKQTKQRTPHVLAGVEEEEFSDAEDNEPLSKTTAPIEKLLTQGSYFSE